MSTADQQSEIDRLKQQVEFLQKRVTRSLAVEQQLFDSRHKVDQELQRFKGISEFGERLASVWDVDHFFMIAAEAIVDIFEVESSAVWLLHQDGTLPSAPIASAEVSDDLGLWDGVLDWSKREELLQGNKSRVLVADSDNIAQLFPFQRIIAAPLLDSNKQTVGMVVGSISQSRAQFYDVDLSVCSNSFAVFVQLVSTLYQTLVDTLVIRSQNQSLETKVAEQTRGLIQSEKMASLGTLAAGVAHEINNPVGFVKSNVNVLKDYQATVLDSLRLVGMLHERDDLSADVKCLVDNAWQNDLDFIIEDIEPLISETLNGVDRVAKIVSGLKRFAHPSDYVKAAVNINDCLEAAIAVSYNQLKHRATLQTEFGDIPTVLGNESELAQVFVNILVNAAQAIKDKNGNIVVKTWVEDDSVFVEIGDDGVGISPKHLQHLFEPFFTTKKIGEGTGLGLSISHGIVQDHGGSIKVISQVNEGTTFRIALPVHHV